MPGEATVPGVYDYWLGGGQHLRADRDVGKAIAERFPRIPGHVQAAHGFHLRAARWCAGRGVRLFVHAGAVTYREGNNIHDAVRTAVPDARVCYVNEDPAAHDFASRLLADGDRITAALASPGYPPQVLEIPQVAGMAGTGAPLCVIYGMVMHFAVPGTAAAAITACATGLPAGSYIAVSVMTAAGDPAADAALAGMFTPARIYPYSADDVAAWMSCTSLEEPGVTDVRALPDGARAGPWTGGPEPGKTVSAIGRVLRT